MISLIMWALILAGAILILGGFLCWIFNLLIDMTYGIILFLLLGIVCIIAGFMKGDGTKTSE